MHRRGRLLHHQQQQQQQQQPPSQKQLEDRDIPEWILTSSEVGSRPVLWRRRSRRKNAIFWIATWCFGASLLVRCARFLWKQQQQQQRQRQYQPQQTFQPPRTSTKSAFQTAQQSPQKPASSKTDRDDVDEEERGVDWYSSRITFIFTGMARVCHPSTALFERVWESHQRYFEGFDSMKRLVVWDGFGDVRLEELNKTTDDLLNETAYREFQQRVEQNVLLMPRADHEKNKPTSTTTSTKVIRLDKHYGLRGSMNYTLHHYVDTPLVYVTQDDLSLTSYIPTAAIVKTMLQQQQQQQQDDDTKGHQRSNNPVRYVILNKRHNGGRKRLDSFYNHWEYANSTTTLAGDVISQRLVVDPATIHAPLLRTKRFSDNNHFAFKQDYLEHILPRAKKEWMDSFHQGFLSQHPEAWMRYGTHILGELHDPAKIEHLDGRDIRWCDHYEEQGDKQYDAQ